MTILVTGGTGFIGSHTCLELVRKNHEIVVLDSLVNSSKISISKVRDILKIENSNHIANIKFFKCDIKNESLLRDIFNKQIKINKPIKSVIHFAGLKSVYESFHKPICYWENNLGGSITLLKVMEEFNCKNLVFSSSATVYDSTNASRIKENHPLKPVNPYGHTKLSIENFLRSLCEVDSHTWRIVSLRYFNPIGAHESGLLGESPNGIPNNIFPYLCKVADKQLPELKIFGNDWPTPDGTGVRDYIHVVDLALAHIKAVDYIVNNVPGYINFNIGTSIGTSVMELIKTFEEENKCKIKYVISQRRIGDKAEVVANNDLMKKTLKWEPKYNVKNMCRDGWKFQKLYPLGFINK